MKYLLVPSIFLCICFFSCSKKDTATDPAIYGAWELRESYGGFSSRIEYPIGNGRVVDFRQDGKVYDYDKNQLINTQAYKVSRYSGNCAYAKGEMAIIYNGNIEGQMTFRINRDTLKISGPPCWEDVGTVVYVRLPQNTN